MSPQRPESLRDSIFRPQEFGELEAVLCFKKLNE
jgi:hypothetical protein